MKSSYEEGFFISSLYKDILANVLFPMFEKKDLMNLILTCKENRDMCIKILLLNQDNQNKAAIHSFKIYNYAYVKTWLEMTTGFMSSCPCSLDTWLQFPDSPL